MSVKILAVGLESCDPQTLIQLSEKGVLPSLSKIMKTKHSIKNVDGFSAGAFWPSAFTGLSPAGHGRYSINQLVSGSYNFSHRPDDSLRVEPVWKLLDDQGYSCFVMDVHRAPCTPLKNSVIVCDWMSHHPTSSARTYPEYLLEELDLQYGKDPYKKQMEQLFNEKGFSYFVDHKYCDEPDLLIKALLERIEKKTKVAEDFLKKKEWDFFFFNFPDMHDVGHLFWHLVDNKEKEHNCSIGNPVEVIYEALDKAVQTLFDATKSEHRIVLGGPGMQKIACYNPILDAILAKIEGEELSNEWDSLKFKEAKTFDKLIEMQGKPISQKSKNSRKFFVLPNNSNYGAIRLNLKGREPNGVIDPNDYDKELKMLSQALKRLVDKDTGLPSVVTIAYPNRDLEGEFKDELPDLMVKWNPDVQTRKVSSPEIGILEWTPKWIRTGDHSQEGILLVDSLEPSTLSHLKGSSDFLSPMVFSKIVMELLEPKMAMR